MSESDGFAFRASINQELEAHSPSPVVQLAMHLGDQSATDEARVYPISFDHRKPSKIWGLV